MKVIGKLKDVLQDMQGNALVTFIVNNYAQRHLLTTLDASKTYSIEINEVKSKRTIQQNKYLWALLSEIDVAINGKPTDEYAVYTMCLERANAKYEYIVCVPQAEQMLKENFRAIKFVKKLDINGREGNMYKCFIGSSKMNTKEMNLLIDTVLDVAQEVGIETTYYREMLWT